MKLLLPALRLALCLSLISVTAVQADTPAPTTQPTLAVSIAVPAQNGSNIRSISLSTADPHIDVVLRNVSSQPQEFFTETCSAGYNALHLELLAVDGKTLTPPIIVRREVGSWDANAIFTVTLKPGDVMVREVHFTDDRSFFGIPYKNFPVMTAGETHTIRMQAVFEVLPGAAPSKLWTGRVVSEPTDYRIEQYSP